MFRRARDRDVSHVEESGAVVLASPPHSLGGSPVCASGAPQCIEPLIRPRRRVRQCALPDPAAFTGRLTQQNRRRGKSGSARAQRTWTLDMRSSIRAPGKSLRYMGRPIYGAPCRYSNSLNRSSTRGDFGLEQQFDEQMINVYGMR